MMAMTISPWAARSIEPVAGETAKRVVTTEHSMECGATTTVTDADGKQETLTCRGELLYDNYSNDRGGNIEKFEYRHKCTGCGQGRFLPCIYPYYTYDDAAKEVHQTLSVDATAGAQVSDAALDDPESILR